MAVDLPPPLPPQQGELAQVQTGEAVAVVPFQDYQIHVLGARVVDGAALAAAVAAADNVSNAVRALAAAYLEAGYPAAQLTYALNGKDLYVLATLGGVSSVQAKAPLGAYFQGLAGVSPLTDDALEPKRMLASMHADRAGLNAEPLLVPDGAGGYAFDLKPDSTPAEPTAIKLEYGNPGNRFVARHFLDLDVRTGTEWGDEIRATTRAGLRGLNTEQNGDDYFEQNLGWNRVTPWGLYGLAARYVDYTVDGGTLGPGVFLPPNPQQNGEIWVTEGYWAYPWFADFDSRTSSLVKVDHTVKTTRQLQGGAAAGPFTDTEIQGEEYTSVELGGSVAHTFRFYDHRWDFDGGISVRKGLGDEPASDAAPDFGYLLFRPAARIKLHLPQEGWTVALEGSGQFSGDTVPEQQQWVLGGFGSLTSYLPGVAVGDTGYLLRLVGELGAYEYAGVSFKPRAFVESGGTTFENIDAGSPMLADVGVQVDAAWQDWVEASVGYAESVADSDVSELTLDQADANVYFRVAIKF